MQNQQQRHIRLPRWSLPSRRCTLYEGRRRFKGIIDPFSLHLATQPIVPNTSASAMLRNLAQFCKALIFQARRLGYFVQHDRKQSIYPHLVWPSRSRLKANDFLPGVSPGGPKLAWSDCQGRAAFMTAPLDGTVAEFAVKHLATRPFHMAREGPVYFVSILMDVAYNCFLKRQSVRSCEAMAAWDWRHH